MTCPIFQSRSPDFLVLGLRTNGQVERLDVFEVCARIECS